MALPEVLAPTEGERQEQLVAGLWASEQLDALFEHGDELVAKAAARIGLESPKPQYLAMYYAGQRDIVAQLKLYVEQCARNVRERENG